VVPLKINFIENFNWVRMYVMLKEQASMPAEMYIKTNRTKSLK
jgi:hypothetical protein